MVAEIVSVGSEILLGQIADTDAQVLGAIFPDYGISHFHRQTVGDNLDRLTAALKLALSRSDIVVTIGGLGPTEDDLTREGIAAALDVEFTVDEERAERLRRLFEQRKIPWVESQRKQAMKPDCGEFIENPNGSAPGLVCRKDGRTVIAMPGPRYEFVPMANGPVREIFGQLAGDKTLASRTLKVAGMGESVVEEAIRDLIHGSNPSVGVYAHPGDVHLRLTALAPTHKEAEAMIAPLEAAIRDRLPEAIYGADGETLESVINDMLRSRGETLSVAESCTGGMLGMKITSIPGASDVFMGGAITYVNELKEAMLGVPHAPLEVHGAVSRETAEAMSSGARTRLSSTWALSITGIAGPGGGTDTKPVGLVYIGLAGPDGVTVEEHRFRGTREFIRLRSAQAALTLLWKLIR